MVRRLSAPIPLRLSRTERKIQLRERVEQQQAQKQLTPEQQQEIARQKQEQELSAQRKENVSKLSFQIRLAEEKLASLQRRSKKGLNQEARTQLSNQIAFQSELVERLEEGRDRIAGGENLALVDVIQFAQGSAEVIVKRRRAPVKIVSKKVPAKKITREQLKKQREAPKPQAPRTFTQFEFTQQQKEQIASAIQGGAKVEFKPTGAVITKIKEPELIKDIKFGEVSFLQTLFPKTQKQILKETGKLDVPPTLQTFLDVKASKIAGKVSKFLEPKVVLTPDAFLLKKLATTKVQFSPTTLGKIILFSPFLSTTTQQVKALVPADLKVKFQGVEQKIAGDKTVFSRAIFRTSDLQRGEVIGRTRLVGQKGDVFFTKTTTIGGKKLGVRAELLTGRFKVIGEKQFLGTAKGISQKIPVTVSKTFLSKKGVVLGEGAKKVAGARVFTRGVTVVSDKQVVNFATKSLIAKKPPLSFVSSETLLKEAGGKIFTKGVVRKLPLLEKQIVKDIIFVKSPFTAPKTSQIAQQILKQTPKVVSTKGIKGAGAVTSGIATKQIFQQAGLSDVQAVLSSAITPTFKAGLSPNVATAGILASVLKQQNRLSSRLISPLKSRVLQKQQQKIALLPKQEFKPDIRTKVLSRQAQSSVSKLIEKQLVIPKLIEITPLIQEKTTIPKVRFDFTLPRTPFAFGLLPVVPFLKKKKKKKRKGERFRVPETILAPSFTARALGLRPLKVTIPQARQLLKKEFTGFELIPPIQIIKNKVRIGRIKKKKRK